jgi:hypothetical protein
MSRNAILGEAQCQVKIKEFPFNNNNNNNKKKKSSGFSKISFLKLGAYKIPIYTFLGEILLALLIENSFPAHFHQ